MKCYFGQRTIFTQIPIIFPLEVDLQLEVQCRNISIFALSCFKVKKKNIIVYNGITSN